MCGSFELVWELSISILIHVFLCRGKSEAAAIKQSVKICIRKLWRTLFPRDHIKYKKRAWWFCKLYLEIFHCVFQGLDRVSRVSSLYGTGVAHAHLVIHAVVSGGAQQMKTRLRRNFRKKNWVKKGYNNKEKNVICLRNADMLIMRAWIKATEIFTFFRIRKEVQLPLFKILWLPITWMTENLHQHIAS